MEKSNVNPFLELNTNGKEILNGLKVSVSSFGKSRELGQNISSLESGSKVEEPLGLNTIAYVGHTILKIIATIAISVLILLGVVGFVPLVMISNNVILDVMVPLSFYQGICGFAIYYMWTPMKGWGSK